MVASKLKKDINGLILLYPGFNIGDVIHLSSPSLEEMPDVMDYQGWVTLGKIYGSDLWDIDVYKQACKYDKDKLYKKIKKEVDKKYDEVAKNIEVVLNIVPYNKFGIMGDYLISLDDEYFRDKTKVVAFKYGGKMTLIGHLTNIVNNDVNGAETNIFSTFPSIINTFMLTFFNKKEIKIVHPIAIYY